MKKAIKIFSLLTVICSLLTIVTCSSGESDTATISISLSDLPGEAAKAVTVDQLQHVIVLSGPADSQTLTITGSGTATATVAVGTWSIRVTAYYGEEVYAVGNATAEVRAGRNTDVSVHMTVVYKEPGSTTTSGGGSKGPGQTQPAGPTKSNGADLSGPLEEDLTKRTADSITLKPANLLTPTGQTIEYAISSTGTASAASLSWQDSLEFTGLTEFATYYFYARSQENDDYLAGTPIVSEPIIAGATIKTWGALSSAIGAVGTGASATFLLEGEGFVVGDVSVNTITITDKTITLLPVGDVQIMRDVYTGEFFLLNPGNLTLGQPGMGGIITLYGGNIPGIYPLITLQATSPNTSTLKMYDNVTMRSNIGGAVNIGDNSTFDMFGGTIKENTATMGGGVNGDMGSTFNMYGGAIGPDNEATGVSPPDGGGGVHTTGTFNMSGDAIITGNTAEKGGGVYVSGSGSLVMTGNAEISGNKATNSSGSALGGGVCFDSTNNFDMLFGNPKINGNTAFSDTPIGGSHGGGVYLDNGTFTMSAGQINGNKADGNTANGGGVYIGMTGVLTKTGGEINGHDTGDFYDSGKNAVFMLGDFVVAAPSGPGHAVYDAVGSYGRYRTAGTGDSIPNSTVSTDPFWDF